MSEELSMLESFFEINNEKFSLKGVRVRRFADIQEEICCRAVGGGRLSQSYEDGLRQKLSVIDIKTMV